MSQSKKSKSIVSKLEKVEEGFNSDQEMPRLQVDPNILKNLKSQNQAKIELEQQIETKQKCNTGSDALFALKFFTSGAIIGLLGYFLLPYFYKKYIKKSD